MKIISILIAALIGTAVYATDTAKKTTERKPSSESIEDFRTAFNKLNGKYPTSIVIDYVKTVVDADFNVNMGGLNSYLGCLDQMFSARSRQEQESEVIDCAKRNANQLTYSECMIPSSMLWAKSLETIGNICHAQATK